MRAMLYVVLCLWIPVCLVWSLPLSLSALTFVLFPGRYPTLRLCLILPATIVAFGIGLLLNFIFIPLSLLSAGLLVNYFLIRMRLDYLYSRRRARQRIRDFMNGRKLIQAEDDYL